MLASPIYQKLQHEDQSLDVSQNNYIIDRNSQDNFIHYEVQNCKHAFVKLDETNHEFITVADDRNSQCYIFGAILDTMEIDAPKQGKFLTIFMRKGIQKYWKELSTKVKEKCFYKAKGNQIWKLVGQEVLQTL